MIFVGDKVKVIKNFCDWNNSYNDKFIGQKGKVIDVDYAHEYPYEVEFDNEQYETLGWKEEELELVAGEER